MHIDFLCMVINYCYCKFKSGKISDIKDKNKGGWGAGYNKRYHIKRYLEIAEKLQNDYE